MLKKIFVGTSLIVAASAANAATVTYTDTTEMLSEASATTNWDKTLELPDFDTSLGTLTGVQLTYFGEIQGDAKVESLDMTAAMVTVNLSAELSFTLQGDLRKVLIPTISESVSLTPFDGTIDYAGGSGNDFGKLATSESESGPLFASNFGQYTDGVMNVFEVNAAAASSATGSGNIVSQFGSRALARVRIVYTYEPTPVVNVATPSHLALLGLGLIGVAGVRRLRK